MLSASASAQSIRNHPWITTNSCMMRLRELVLPGLIRNISSNVEDWGFHRLVHGQRCLFYLICMFCLFVCFSL